jgi:hypothetical protein
MHFTVVVPTRERCDTLGPTLRTLTSQDRDDLTIIVSDNASEDATRDVVEAARDPRVRYVNTGRRVSMTSNWEFGLSHVEDRETYVFFCGDDDGLLPHALDDLAALLADTGARAVSWKKADYTWPSWAQVSWRNVILLPMENRLVRYESADALRDAARMWIPYYRLPALYNSVVDARVLHALRRREGRFFWSQIPDAYSGYAALAGIEWYLYSTRPFSLNGGSGHSTGASFGSTTNAAPRARFLAEQDLPPHPRLKPLFGSMVACVMEPLLQANDHALDGRLTLPRPWIVRNIFRELQPRHADVWAAAVGELTDFARERGDRALLSTIRAMRALYPNRPTEAPPSAPPPYGLTAARTLVVDLAQYGVLDVDAACRWTGNLLGPYRRPAVTRYHARDKVLTRAGEWFTRRVPDWTL